MSGWEVDDDGMGAAEQPRGLDSSAEPVGRFHAWWRGDPLPILPMLPGLSIEPVQDERLIGALTGIGLRDVRERMRRHHEPWLARIADESVGWGWCARAEAAIGELGISRPLPPGHRYVWDCFTVPSRRGQGIYPRLLQSIVRRNVDGERFWVGHDLANTASARGIAKAGFREVGLLYRRQDGGFILVPSGSLPRAAAAAELFGVEIAPSLAAQTA